MRRSFEMRPRGLLLLVMAAGMVSGDTVLLSHDADGRLLRQAPALFRQNGLALASRDALFGAKSAVVLDDQGRTHPVIFVSGEDPDAGVVEVFVGLQAPHGPASASSFSRKLHTWTHKAEASELKESGAFGEIATLQCPKQAGSHEDGPIFDEHELFVGWHVSRQVDGRRLSFAVPSIRFEAMSKTVNLPVEAWSAAVDPEREQDYRRALGHLWSSEFDGALFYFRKATDSEPGNARAWMHRGFVEGKAGYGKTRLDCYEKATLLAPKLAEVHYYLGFVRLMRGEVDEARAEYESLKELGSPYAERLRKFIEAAHVDVLEHPEPKHKKIAQSGLR
jgi:tetratricopeptide (TPR) repeat protein